MDALFTATRRRGYRTRPDGVAALTLTAVSDYAAAVTFASL